MKDEESQVAIAGPGYRKHKSKCKAHDLRFFSELNEVPLPREVTIDITRVLA